MATELESGDVRGLYTAAQLAELVHAPTLAIRRWHRRGFLVAACESHRVAYFDMAEVYVARTLADLLTAGCTLASIDTQVDQLESSFPNTTRPLKELPLVVMERRLLLRRGTDLIEPSGQLQIDFDEELEPATPHDVLPAVFPIVPNVRAETSADQLRRHAAECESHGDHQGAIEAYRLVVSLAEAVAEDHFVLGDLLYREGDLSAARERYFVAIELDENYAEARVNLGCVLSELGEFELAEAALRGAIRCHPDYADAHYHLGQLLDLVGRGGDAANHWGIFCELAPEGPWKHEALDRVGIKLGKM